MHIGQRDVPPSCAFHAAAKGSHASSRQEAEHPGVPEHSTTPPWPCRQTYMREAFPHPAGTIATAQARQKVEKQILMT